MWAPGSAGGPINGKNGETQGRTAAIKSPTHVALLISPARSCSATADDEVRAPRLAVIESEAELFTLIDGLPLEPFPQQHLRPPVCASYCCCRPKREERQSGANRGAI